MYSPCRVVPLVDAYSIYYNLLFTNTLKIFPKDIFLPKMGNSKSKRSGAKREKEMVNVVICVQSFQLLNPRSKIQRSAISINVGVSREKKQCVSRFRDFPFFYLQIFPYRRLVSEVKDAVRTSCQKFPWSWKKNVRILIDMNSMDDHSVVVRQTLSYPTTT